MPAPDPVSVSEPALAVSGLRKVFGETVAVDGVSLTVAQGSLYGLVGPNGAGKTTTISMAVGLLRPDAGVSRIFGVDVWREPVRAKALVGVLPDGFAIPHRLTGRELLTYLGLLRGMDPATVDARVASLLAVFDLDDAERTLIVEYSAGMRKKIGLATALLHAPRLLVLDEPLEAVDPVSAAKIKAILLGFVARGGAVVISSHVMPLVEELCDQVAVIDKGRVAASGPTAAVRGGGSLESAFVRLVGAEDDVLAGRHGPDGSSGLEWLAPSFG